ncbi:MAG: hypothetical protein WD043_11305 [Gemmatimonadales bacterium]
MRLLIIAGLVLAALGVFILTKGLTYGPESSVVRVGDFQMSAETERAIPPWAGWVAVLGGVALIGAGVGRRRSR